jgi:diguanylate cyclase (GGDEF)-like protein
MNNFDVPPPRENGVENFIERIEQLQAENNRLSRENERLTGENAELKKTNEILEKNSTKDPLTEMYNRRGFSEELNHVLVQEPENGKEQRDIAPKENAVLILDIDNFKKINDTYGHDAGDEVLRQAAAFLKKSTRKTDIICRWGGEEFVIVLQNINAKQVIQKFYNKEEKQAQIGFTAAVSGKEIPITFSGGATEISADKKIEENIANADERLYRAKHEGKNRIYR